MSVLLTGVTHGSFNMKSFIRVLWGEGRGRYPNHRSKLDFQIKKIINNCYTVPFVTYVYGANNFSVMKDMGLECKLIDSKPIAVSPKKSLVHKILALNEAMNDFNEVVLMDWDCSPITPLPSDFWQELGKKDVIQCPLYKCPRRVNTWRSGRVPPKILSGGFFVYLRDRAVSSELVKWTNGNISLPNTWSDEIFYSKYIDDMMSGWDDGKNNFKTKEYFKRFQPKWCNNRSSCFKPEPKACFYHPKT